MKDDVLAGLKLSMIPPLYFFFFISFLFSLHRFLKCILCEQVLTSSLNSFFSFVFPYSGWLFSIDDLAFGAWASSVAILVIVVFIYSGAVWKIYILTWFEISFFLT